ncbi:hypothetical protein [Caldibacillus debilis]|uniref:hypothetical protein n=1 Tax=Caldibacillus debilis TaxID=301148 RepID=UPI000378FAB5|nr:hypothetical protein [Caldibacillus debilis]
MSEEIKLPASSYEELIKIIMAYGSTKIKEPNLEELSKLCGIPTTTISRNSGFLVATGIIEGGKSKTITEKGKALARALEHNKTDEISRLWREIILENEFLNKMVTAIKIRNGMDHQSFQSHIAYSSGQSNNSYVKTGSNTVIEIIKIAELIVESDGKLIIKNQTDDSVNIEETRINSLNKEETGVNNFEINRRNGILINIDIKVHAKVDELDYLAEKLKKILSDINNLDD